MGAVWARLASELRSRWRSTAALVLVVGLTAGVVMAATAGARRTDTAYTRFLEDTKAEDVFAAGDFSPEGQALYRRMERLPQVEAAAGTAGMIIVADGLDTPYHFAGIDRRFGRDIARPKVIRGRLPDPDSADEVLINRAMARQRHLDVGDLFTGTAFDGEDFDASGGEPAKTTVRLKVVGVGVFASDVVPTSSFDALPIFYPPYGYYRAHPDLKQGYGFWWFRLKHGAADFAAFQAGADRIVREAGAEFDQAGTTDQSGRTAKVKRAVRPQAVALLGFAILTALAGLLVVGQALARQLATEAIEYPALRAMGMAPRQLLAVALARVGIVGALGAVLGVVLAIVSSPLMPIGPARVAEPHPGLAVNLAVVGLGAVAVMVLLLARLAWPAWRAARARPDAVGAGRGSRLAEGLARVGVPPSPVVGVRMALEPGRGRTAVPVRSALVGTAVAVAAVAGAFTFNVNLDRLVTTPRLYGSNWDVVTGVGFFPLPDEVSDDLVADPDVAGVAAGQFSAVKVEGKDVEAIAIDQVGGADVFPTLLEGRGPAGPDEIALGSRTLRRFGKSVGDSVRVESATGRHTLRIVGRAVFPKLGGANLSTTGLGDGAAVTAVHGGPSFDEEDPENVHSIAIVRFKAGVDPAEAVAGVRRIVSDGRFDGCPSALCITNAVQQRPGDIENYARVRGTPLVLAALLVVMALGALAHTLVSSIRRRRRDLAVLKTLGFLRGQVSAATAWQATVLAAVALLVGLPVGVAAGRLAWVAFAHNLGVAEDASTPTLAVLLAVPATVLLANLIATVPALAAARTRPALVLRTE